MGDVQLERAAQPAQHDERAEVVQDGGGETKQRFSTHGSLPPPRPAAHGAGSPPPSPSDRAYGTPQQLPGEMITVTLFDAGWQYISQRSEPLFSDVPGNTFAGELEGDAIRWAGGGALDVRLGDKFVHGQPSGGVSIATWAAQAGNGRARYVKVEIVPTTMKDTGAPGPHQRDDHAQPSGADGLTSATVGAGATADSTSSSAATDRAASTGATASAAHGTTQEGGHRGASATSGSRVDGQSNGAKGGHSADGSRGGPDGRRGGNTTTVGYFYDPDHAHDGTEDTAPDGAVAGGMVGGEGQRGDHGAPGSAAIVKLAIPPSLAAGASLVLILNQTNIDDLADQLVKTAFKLGAGGATEMAVIGAEKFEAFVTKETQSVLAKDASYAAATVEDQAKIAAAVHDQVAAETRKLLTEALDRRIGQAGKATIVDGIEKGQFAGDAVQSDVELADAARRAKESLPNKSGAVETKPLATTSALDQTREGPPGASSITVYEAAANGGRNSRILEHMRGWPSGRLRQYLNDLEDNIHTIEGRIDSIEHDPTEFPEVRKRAPILLETLRGQVTLMDEEIQIGREVLRIRTSKR